jgi:hypothetical protein
MTQIGACLVLVVAALACRPPSTAIANHAEPSTVPPGYTRLPGPSSCEAPECTVTTVRDITADGIRRVGLVTRGMDATLAIETRSGWFLEPHVERKPAMSSHHQPHSRGYDLDATRVEAGAIVVRLIDSQSVFYPGQGGAGSSSTTWYERRCTVIDGIVHCSEPVQIASESCKTADGPTFERTCTGSPPR